MIRVIMRRYRGLCTELAFALQRRKTSARRPCDEGDVLPGIASNKVPYLQVRSAGPHSTSGKEKKGEKERTGSKKVFDISEKR